jgi:2,4-dienoyl-CoA reductase-like NADH-dependent reductase (Old Yellow Enzyme family)
VSAGPASHLRVLLEPYDLASLELRNRIVSTSHASGFAEGGIPGERYIAYHEEKARGGVAMTMFGGSSIVSPEVSSIYRQIDVSTGAVIPHFQEFARRVHRHGTKLVCQISHMGRRTAWDDGDWIVPISPSTEKDPAHHAVPRAMEAEDIDRVIADYGTAARRCAEGGLDGVEVMVSSHLPGQFLSPESNRRSDEWGGSLDNRMRFLERVLREIRAGTPEGFVLSLRMSVDESWEGGADAQECREVAVPQTIEPSNGPRRHVVVVGGGPAGMEAARVARRRGHEVVLFEASDRLGGQVVVAAKAAWRHDLASITGWLAAEIVELGVDVRLGTPADADDVLHERPDLVIVATGGAPRWPQIPGAELTVSAWDVLAGQARVEPGARVLLLDEEGRHAGISVAQHLAEHGATVTIVTPDRLVGRELGGSSYPVYLGALARSGVTVMTDRHLVRVEPVERGRRATLRHEYGETEQTVDVDAVVTQLGTAPIDDVFHALKGGARNHGGTDVHALRDAVAQPWFAEPGAGYLLFRVGDAVASRDIHAALLDSLRILKDC